MTRIPQRVDKKYEVEKNKDESGVFKGLSRWKDGIVITKMEKTLKGASRLEVK